MTRTAILAMDEGTTGTRSALVMEDGSVRHLTYRTLSIRHPVPGVVEQDFGEIWSQTLVTARQVVEAARAENIEIVAVAIAVQRSTCALWNRRTGAPLGPGMVWQDTRHAEELATLGDSWNPKLLATTGRVAGVRSPYLWAGHRLREEQEVRDVLDAGDLLLGTVDTWLTWQLTGGRKHVASTTNVVAAGGYDLDAQDYFREWIEAQGVPAELLPELVDDGGTVALTDPSVLGIEVPIRAVLGDQHAALLGLGCLETGEGSCIHGTGSFVDQLVESDVRVPLGHPEAVVRHVGWKCGDPVLALENYTATTGSALNWACEELQWFRDPVQISELAAQSQLWTEAVPFFAPTLTGVRLPRVETRVQGSLTQLNLATTRVQLAQGMLEGIAQCVARSIEANATAAGCYPGSIRVGGGLSQSDPLLQLQADLTGYPMLRYAETDKATVRGAAFLAGNGLVWESLRAAVDTMPQPQQFDPQLSEDQRLERVTNWRSIISSELTRLDENHH